MIRHLLAVTTLAFAAPALAETRTVEPGAGAQERLQEALILAEPGDTIQLAAGRYTLSDGLSLDVDNVTVRGAGMDKTVLDFTTQAGAGEGLLVTSDEVTLRDFRMENPKGDGVKSKGADNIVYYRIRVAWTNGPDSGNGAYAIYPVESTGVLIDGVQVSGASDAGIYVGQSRDITVRNSIAEANVAGIEIENSRNALVENNFATRNTGGILVFDLPNLPVMGGGNVVIRGNIVAANDEPNFAPPGNIVGSVRRGTGVLIMANDSVLIEGNMLSDNPTSDIMVIAYPLGYTDETYNPYARNVQIGSNFHARSGTDPQMPMAEQLVAGFDGALPPVLWDGLSQDEATRLMAVDGTNAWTLNLAKLGDAPGSAMPGPVMLTAPVGDFDTTTVGAPAALGERIAG